MIPRGTMGSRVGRDRGQATDVLLTLEELQRWGEEFGRSATAPLIVAIAGDLGAGKTTLVQAICRGYGVESGVTSPTFALVHEYTSPRSPVYHLDLYRLRNADELTNLGWDDIIASRALTLIEWPDRAGARLPPEAVLIALGHVPNDSAHRRLTAR